MNQELFDRTQVYLTLERKDHIKELFIPGLCFFF